MRADMGKPAIVSGAVCGSSALTILRGVYRGDPVGLLTGVEIIKASRKNIFRV